MNKPVPPCKGCEDRNIEYCITCPKWQEYTEERKKYYDYKYSQSTVKTAWMERFNWKVKRAINFKNGKLK